MTGPVMMNQGWRDLTFLHWAVDPGLVAHRMPPGVRPDTLDGVTYVGLILFRMVGAGIARGPGVPWLGSFLETNVRLYWVDATDAAASCSSALIPTGRRWWSVRGRR